MRCPVCGCTDTYVVSDTTTSGSHVNVCNGVLGFMCFGPIGLLCSFLGGNKRKMTLSYVVCNRCHLRSRI